jgi:predicted DNA-binding protein YlxM (UPF0122 family)
MLTEKEISVVRNYYKRDKSVPEIAAEHGYSDRSSVYKIIKKPEAQELIKELTEGSVSDSIRMLKTNTTTLVKELLDIAKGKVGDHKTVYARLQAINSGLEKAGLNSKTIVLENKGVTDDEYNELKDLLEELSNEE